MQHDVRDCEVPFRATRLVPQSMPSQTRVRAVLRCAVQTCLALFKAIVGQGLLAERTPL